MPEGSPDPQDNPGVLVHPPILYAGGLLVGAIFNQFMPASFAGLISSRNLILWPGIVLLAGGIILISMAVRQFRRAGTNVPTNKPAVQLVTDGVYRFTRNPIYVSLSCIYAGLALIWDSPWTLGLLVPVLITMRFGVIAREEKYLTAKFGAAYTEFLSKTRRWL